MSKAWHPARGPTASAASRLGDMHSQVSDADMHRGDGHRNSALPSVRLPACRQEAFAGELKLPTTVNYSINYRALLLAVLKLEIVIKTYIAPKAMKPRHMPSRFAISYSSQPDARYYQQLHLLIK